MYEESYHDCNADENKTIMMMQTDKGCLDVKEEEGSTLWTVTCLHRWIFAVSCCVGKHKVDISGDFLPRAAVKCRCAFLQCEFMWLIIREGFYID